MTKTAISRSPTIAAAIAAAILVLAAAGVHGGRLLGGRTEVRNAREDAEVQALGRFSVEEYKRERRNSAEAEAVEFAAVVAVEKQVVAGIKYYLKVEATVRGEKEMFDSEVVVVPWERSKRLLKFAPSSSIGENWG